MGLRGGAITGRDLTRPRRIRRATRGAVICRSRALRPARVAPAARMQTQCGSVVRFGGDRNGMRRLNEIGGVGRGPWSGGEGQLFGEALRLPACLICMLAGWLADWLMFSAVF